MRSGIWWYKKGFKHCIELLEEMAESDDYDSWNGMISELKERTKEEE